MKGDMHAMRLTFTNVALFVVGIIVTLSIFVHGGKDLLGAACVGGILMGKAATKKPLPNVLLAIGVTVGLLTLLITFNVVSGVMAKALAALVILLLGFVVLSKWLLRPSQETV